jgi:hypothetical protein
MSDTPDIPKGTMRVVGPDGPEMRVIDHVERIDGALRYVPYLADNERLEWVFGDTTPHIFREP